MDKLFFGIYKDETKTLQHLIVHRPSKKALETELRDRGLVPKAIFGQKDVDKIMKNEFMNMAVRDADIEYFKNHIEEWKNAE